MAMELQLINRRSRDGGNFREECVNFENVANREHTVFIKDVSYDYNKVTAIENVNSTIYKGEIYALMGPSGCGKTTLLRCILGLIKPKKGEITLFGKGQCDSNYRTLIGYMPQDTGLQNEFNIKECLHFFGEIHGFSTDERKRRIEFLANELDLPDSNNPISKLSGGEKRRVSLAIALFHSPPLLVLDEPTVGVDPLLTSMIWKYLLHLSNRESVTVIMTTHQVNEARQANRVAMMRSGSLLIEETPEKLLTLCNTDTLDAAFSFITKEKRNIGNQRKGQMIMEESKPFLLEKTSPKSSEFTKTIAMTKKCALRVRRSLLELFLQSVLPAIQAILILFAINEPKNVTVAVYNGDTSYSLVFLQQFDENYIDFVEYESAESAIDAVTDGNAWAAFTIDEKYTDVVSERLRIFGKLPHKMKDKGIIKLYTDSTGFSTYFTILFETHKAMVNYIKHLAENGKLEFSRKHLTSSEQYLKYLFERHKEKLKFNKHSITEPFFEIVNPPIFGPIKPTFRDHVSLPMMSCILFLQSLSLTGFSFFFERKFGIVERLYANDVHMFHIWFSHFFIQTAILMVQSIILLLVTIAAGVYCSGSLILVFNLLALQGFQGMSLGFFLSSFIFQEIMAAIVVAALFVTGIIISGIMAPLESMPIFIRYASYLSPHTLTILALRCVTGRACDLLHTKVLLGFLHNIFMILLLNTLGFIIYKKNK